MRILLLMIFIFSVNSHSSEESTVDLDCFKNYALSQIRQTYGNLSLKNAMITFHDGVGSTDTPPLFDYARILYSAEVAGWTESGVEARVGFLASLQGFSKVQLVEYPDHIKAVYYSPISLISQLTLPVDPSFNQFRDSLSKEFPKFHQQFIKRTGIFLLSSGPANQLSHLFERLLASELFQEVALDAETYRVPFEFDKPIRLNLSEVRIDLDSLRHASQKYKDAGYPFTTNSHLPKMNCIK